MRPAAIKVRNAARFRAQLWPRCACMVRCASRTVSGRLGVAQLHTVGHSAGCEGRRAPLDRRVRSVRLFDLTGHRQPIPAAASAATTMMVRIVQAAFEAPISAHLARSSLDGVDFGSPESVIRRSRWSAARLTSSNRVVTGGYECESQCSTASLAVPRKVRCSTESITMTPPDSWRSTTSLQKAEFGGATGS